MDDRKAKLSQFIFMDDAGDLVLNGEITYMLGGFEAKSYLKPKGKELLVEISTFFIFNLFSSHQ